MRNRKSDRVHWLGEIAVLVAALVSVSCGGAMPQTSHAAGTASAANLTLNSSNIDFGNVSVGGSKANSITLTNSSPSGGASVTFSKVTTTGSAFSTSTPSLPIVLTPGQSSTIIITFAPTSAGALTGSLSVTVVERPIRRRCR